MSAHLKTVKPEVSDEALYDLALELEQQHDDDEFRLCQAVLKRDYVTAEKLARELRPDAAN